MAQDHDQDGPVGPDGQTAASGADGDQGAPGGFLGQGLTSRQEQALIALLNQPTLTQAAKASGIGERTIYTWLREPAFARAYREARRQSFSHAISLTQRYSALAIGTLAKVMTDKKSSDSAKVQAACAMLKFSRDSIELDDLANRLEALEVAAKAVGSRGGVVR